ncbi:MAG: ACP S-malonyltransferase [Nitrospirota bacterium]
MPKIAFLFPGQGCQYKGMGKELFEDYQEVRDIYDIASDGLKWDVADLCFNDHENRINETEFTQPAILTTSIAIMSILEKEGIYPSIVAGHSLGEYSAVVAAKGLKFSEMVKIVQKRGQYMTDAVPRGRGMMAAIIGLTKDDVKLICKESSDNGDSVFAANLNSALQIVISGMKSAVERAMSLAKEKGAKKIVALPVSVPSHSPLMESASNRLAAEFEEIKFKKLRVPLVNNTEAREISSPEDIKNSLIKQLISPLLWEDSVKYMISYGIDTFVEVGPGRVLSFLTKKIYKDAAAVSEERQKPKDSLRIFNIEDTSSLKKTIRGLE